MIPNLTGHRSSLLAPNRRQISNFVLRRGFAGPFVYAGMTRPSHKGVHNQGSLEFGRLNRFIARAGVCSRRKADELIAGGMVKVNGKVVNEYWLEVTKSDQVTVNGRLITPGRLMYLLLNKPKDTITTSRDERGRSTVMDLINLPEGPNGLFSVGRLDRNTTGVLLLTSDGDLGYRLMHPRYRVPKQYVVRTRDPVRPHQIDQLRKGIMLEDGPASADQVMYVQQGNHYEVGIEIHEGRNRQLRRMFAALNHDLVALNRVSYAGLTTRGVRRGKWRRLRRHEVNRLRRLVRSHVNSSPPIPHD